MDGELRRFLAEHDHIITARESRAAGIRSEKIRRALETGELLRVVRGGYVTKGAVLAVDYEARHILRTTVVLRTRPGGLAASHTSAAAMWGLPVPASAMERIHVCHRTKKGTTRRHREFTVHCWPGQDAVVPMPGTVPPRMGMDPARRTPLVVPAVAAIQSAMVTRTSIGVGIMDAVRQRGLATVDQLQGWLDRMQFVPGISQARDVLRRSDGLAESPRESWLRLILVDLGYVVVAQHPITENGHVIARVDFYLPELGVVVEFDGRIKYVKEDGTGDGDAVYREKQREDRIRRLGFGMVRVGSHDLANPRLINRHIQDAARTVRLPPPSRSPPSKHP